MAQRLVELNVPYCLRDHNPRRGVSFLKEPRPTISNLAPNGSPLSILNLLEGDPDIAEDIAGLEAKQIVRAIHAAQP